MVTFIKTLVWLIYVLVTVVVGRLLVPAVGLALPSHLRFG